MIEIKSKNRNRIVYIDKLTKEEVEVKAVSFKEFEKNFMNPKWKGWRDLITIESTMKKSICFNDPCSHLYCFLNNYWLEEEVKRALNLEYLGDDHDAIYPYSGTNLCDFIDPKTNILYEVKQGRSLVSAWSIPEKDWHDKNAVKLFYSRENKILFERRPGEQYWTEVIELKPKHINAATLLKLDDILKAQGYKD